MEGAKERARLSGKKAGHTTVNSPSNHSNVVIQTGSVQKSNRNETDLQKAITDYQVKVNKQKTGKSKTTTARGISKNIGNGDSSKYGPLSQKKLADTYMVGGCSMDLNNTFSSQKKATMIFNQNDSYSTKKANASLIQS